MSQEEAAQFSWSLPKTRTFHGHFPPCLRGAGEESPPALWVPAPAPLLALSKHWGGAAGPGRCQGSHALAGVTLHGKDILCQCQVLSARHPSPGTVGSRPVPARNLGRGQLVSEDPYSAFCGSPPTALLGAKKETEAR